MEYIEPKVLIKSFACPHCGVVANQDWEIRTWNFRIVNESSDTGYPKNPIRMSICNHCKKYTSWIHEKMYFPDNGNLSFPNEKTPKNEKKGLFEIVQQSLDIVRLTRNNAVKR